MDSLLSGFLGALFTGVVTIVIAFKDKIRSLFDVRDSRFSGEWIGSAFDIEVEDVTHYKTALDYSLKVDIVQKGKIIKGIAYVDSDLHNKLHFRGLVHDGTYFICQYSNTRFKFRDMGMFIGEIDNMSKEIKGFFSGLRLREHGISIGHFLVKRVT